MAEYIDTRINPADYIEVWEVEDAEHGKQLVMAVDDLKCLPPADVRPVARGKWNWRHRHRGGFRRWTGEDDFGIRHTITVDQRYEIDDPYCPFFGKLNESVFLNYCPNCGAEMIGTDDKKED